MYKSSGILAAQKFLSTAENDTRFSADAFSTIVQLTKRCCLEYGAEHGVAVRETVEMWAAERYDSGVE
jgi:hypothetical protein